jgi:hypothetical protein
MIPAKRFAKLRLIPLRGFASLARRSLPDHSIAADGPMNDSKNRSISRREFGRRAAIASVASLVPGTALQAARLRAPVPQAEAATTLPAESQKEAAARTQTILDLYGSRFSESQKSEIARLSVAAQRQLDRLRAYPAQNSDDPALYLKPLIEHERKSPSPIPAPSTAPPRGLTPPPKKP